MIQPIIDQSGIIHIFKGKQTAPIKLIIGEILTADIMDIFPTGTIQIKINNRILNAQPQRELPLNKGDTVYVKVENPLPDGTITLRLLSLTEIQQMQKDLSDLHHEISEKIFNFIKEMFLIEEKGIYNKQLLSSQPDETNHINLIKTLLSLPLENLSETEKTSLLQRLMDFFSTQKSVAETIKEFISFLEDKSQFKELAFLLKKIIISSSEITPERLKQSLINSGVSFEAKLKHALFDPVKLENIKEDLKSILNTIINEAKKINNDEFINKAQQILRQIDGYQVLSKTYQSFFSFLPIFWRDIEGGNFAFKSFKRQGKEYYSVFVTLNIKEEPISFVVSLINKNFFVSFSGKPETLNLIKTYEKNLKERFMQRGMALGGVNYVEKFEELIKQWSIKEGLISVTV